MDRNTSHQAVLHLVACAAMTAIVYVGNYLRVAFPVPLGGLSSFTLANILCALAGILLGPWFGFAASGLGSAFYDLFGPYPDYAKEAYITFFTKGIYGLVAGLVLYYVFGRLLKKDTASYLPQAVASACAALAYAAAYLLKNYVYNGTENNLTTAAQRWALVASKVPATITNGVIAVIFAPILGVALMKGLRAAHLDRMLAK